MGKRDVVRTSVVLPRAVHEAALRKSEVLATSLSEVVRRYLLEWVQEPLPEVLTRAGVAEPAPHEDKADGALADAVEREGRRIERAAVP
jgi:hypothetical protein